MEPNIGRNPSAEHLAEASAFAELQPISSHHVPLAIGQPFLICE